MRDLKKKNSKAQDRYRWVYDAVISKFYDSSMKIGLSIIGEKTLRETVLNLILPHVKRKDMILDLCCGTGTLTTMLTDLVYSDCTIIGVDLSEGQIFQAVQKNFYPNLKFKVMDASDLRFSAESFNIVLISAALHEMDKDLRIRVLQEVHRVLRNEGFLFIFDHHEPSEPKLRLFYNFYLGFWEKILSHSFDMQRNIFSELKAVKFKPISQIILNKKIYKLFQLIISKK
ncbi:MAG: class I SAM-dependent methyltransferase [Candidatus Lokiarchaeota archaeon]|nr:class I SAM-dependent methyltransferase [Candidatus Lokiarchaeota archaeon]